MIIQTPSQFDRDTLLPFFTELDENKETNSVTVDFSPLRFSKPTATLIAGGKLKHWVQNRFKKGFRSIPSGIDSSIQAHNYLMHVGFFDFIGLNVGNKVGEAQGSYNYMPIKKIINPYLNHANLTVKDWHGLIQEEARGLARILVKSDTQIQEIATYTYCIRELLRNVFEHSGVNECYIFGQKWRTGHAEVAVIDAGRGIKASLAEAHEIESDTVALSLSLRPGISRTNNLLGDKNIYDNSGFGLYVLSSIAASYGWFAFGSYSSRVIGHNNIKREYQGFSFPGTFFGMFLKSSPKNFHGVLQDIISVGEEEAQKNGISKKASGMSRLV